MKRALAAATITLAVLMTGVGVVLADSKDGPVGRIGWLDVTTSNPVEPAQIIIDDAGTNLVTPQKHIPLVEGHHNLTLRTDDGRSSTIGFSVTAKTTTSLVLHPSHH